MKGCVIGGVVLAVVILLVAVNALFVRNTVETLTAALDALPEIPDPSTTPAEIVALREFLESKETLLSLSVSYAVTDKVTEALYSLEAAAGVGDVFQYEETLSLLRDLTEDIGRLERIALRSVLQAPFPRGRPYGVSFHP